MQTKTRVTLAVVISLAIVVGSITIHQYIYSKSSRNGPAATTVKNFFSHWQAKKFDKMAELSTNYGNEAEFVIGLIKSPIHVRNFSLNSVRGKGASWIVSLKAEVTDPQSVMASILVHENMRQRLPSLGMVDVIVSPAILKIERFRSIVQEMSVSCENETKCLIDICRDNVSCKHKDNIMNYVLDAGTILKDDRDRMALANLSDDTEENSEKNIRLAIWLNRTAENLGLSETQARDVVINAHDLYALTPYGKFEDMKRGIFRHTPPPEPTPEPY